MPVMVAVLNSNDSGAASTTGFNHDIYKLRGVYMDSNHDTGSNHDQHALIRAHSKRKRKGKEYGHFNTQRPRDLAIPN